MHLAPGHLWVEGGISAAWNVSKHHEYINTLLENTRVVCDQEQVSCIVETSLRPALPRVHIVRVAVLEVIPNIVHDLDHLLCGISTKCLY